MVSPPSGEQPDAFIISYIITFFIVHGLENSRLLRVHLCMSEEKPPTSAARTGGQLSARRASALNPLRLPSGDRPLLHSVVPPIESPTCGAASAFACASLNSPPACGSGEVPSDGRMPPNMMPVLPVGGAGTSRPRASSRLAGKAYTAPPVEISLPSDHFYEEPALDRRGSLSPNKRRRDPTDDAPAAESSSGAAAASSSSAAASASAAHTSATAAAATAAITRAVDDDESEQPMSPSKRQSRSDSRASGLADKALQAPPKVSLPL